MSVLLIPPLLQADKELWYSTVSRKVVKHPTKVRDPTPRHETSI